MGFQPATVIYFARTGIDSRNKVVCKNQSDLVDICTMPQNRLGVMTDCSFQRGDFRYTVAVDHKQIGYYQLLQADTVLYRNQDTENVFWVFGNITGVEWKNPDCSYVTFQIDHFMTYQTMIDWDKSYGYIEREHVKNDWASDGGNPLFTNIGADEGFSVSADVPIYHWNKEFRPNTVVVQSPYNSSGDTVFEGTLINGLYSSLQTPAFSSAAEANDFFTAIAENKETSINNIMGVYGVPEEFVSAMQNGKAYMETETLPAVDKSNQSRFNLEYNNAKCWAAPYANIRLASSDGSFLDFAPQWFGNDTSDYTIMIKACGAGNQFGGAAATFDNRNGTFSWENWQDFLVKLSELPKCPWTADGFSEWYGINGFNEMMKAATANFTTLANAVKHVGGAASGAVNGDYAGAFENAFQGAADVSRIIQTEAQLGATIGSAKATGAAVSGTQSGGNIFDIGQNAWGFKVVYYTVQNYIMRQIDQYFDRFGYRVNQLKKLELENRPYWTYVKTAECHVSSESGIPFVSQNAINSMFQRGCTFWTLDKYKAGTRPGDFSAAKQNKGIRGG